VRTARRFGGTLMFARCFLLPSCPKVTNKDTIILADFDNKTGDPAFDDTLRHGLSVELQQSLVPEPDFEPEGPANVAVDGTAERCSPDSSLGTCKTSGLLSPPKEFAIMDNERGGRSLRKLAANLDVSEMSFGTSIRANATSIHSACCRSKRSGNSTRASTERRKRSGNEMTTASRSMTG
jgi:hypothetical protein